MKKATIRLSGLLVLGLASCATTKADKAPEERASHMIEGYWSVGETRNVIHVRACKDDEDKLCGHLVEFDGEKNDRDYLHPSWFLWGQKLCDSLIVADLEQSAEEQIFSGTIYDPDEGQVYNLIVLLKTSDQIETRAYMGASIDEAISLGIGALTGDVGVFSTLSFLTRAGIGKEHLGENVEWRRHDGALNRCDA